MQLDLGWQWVRCGFALSATCRLKPSPTFADKVENIYPSPAWKLKGLPEPLLACWVRGGLANHSAGSQVRVPLWVIVQ